jgi:glyoxylase I family protein
VQVADIHHVSLNVADTQRALRFYCDVLGMAQLDRPNFSFAGAWLDAGNGHQIHLIEVADGDVPSNKGQHVAFRVDDVAAVADELRGKGLQVSPVKPVGETDTLQAFVLDPDGNLLEFSQPG